MMATGTVKIAPMKGNEKEVDHDVKKQLFSFVRHLSDTLKYNFARVN